MNEISTSRKALVLAMLSAAMTAALGISPSTAQTPVSRPKSRLLVTTDIGGDPDDEESLVRLLVYSNEFDIEGLVAVPGPGHPPREDIIRRKIDAYEKSLPNLLRHAAGFPDARALRDVTATGQPGIGMAAVGDGKGTPGAHRIIEAADRPDDRPLWVTAWGGTATIAQALWEVRATRPSAELDRFVAKLRVYAISDQDDAGPWLRREFPNLFYIVTPSRPVPDWFEYYRATWTGISGDRFFKVGVGHHFEMVDNPWLKAHIIDDHGPLGAEYPPLKFIMEGDTPSWLGLIDNGLGWDTSPSYGGWGGRYQLYHASTETHPIWTNNMRSRDTVTSSDTGRTETSDQATIWRWREAFQNDFAARMDWCVADDYRKANHNPVAALNGDTTKIVLHIQAKGGSTVSLSAAGTRDPDGDSVRIAWWIYDEAGTVSGALLTRVQGRETSVILPAVKSTGSLHVILDVTDNGSPPLTAYRRAVIEVVP